MICAFLPIGTNKRGDGTVSSLDSHGYLIISLFATAKRALRAYV